MATRKIDVMANLLNWSIQIMANIGELFQNPIVIKSRSIDGLWQNSHCKLADENFKLFLFFWLNKFHLMCRWAITMAFIAFSVVLSLLDLLWTYVCMRIVHVSACIIQKVWLVCMHCRNLSFYFRLFFFAPFALTLSICLARSRLFHSTTKLEFAITTKTIKSKQ